MHKILQTSLFNRSWGKILLLATLTFNFLYSVEPKIVIHWSSVKTSGHAELLKDRTGQPLDAGAPNNGDGNLVVLGYFTDANTTHPFSGIWTPLTFGTRAGDSSSGYGYDNGMISFTTVFTNASNQVIVYPGNPASYNVQSPMVISTSSPPYNKPICIRFYDRTSTGPNARYNTVTGSNWSWPAFSSGIPENLYLKIASGSSPTGSDWKYGSTFEDPSSPFKCSLRDPANLVTSGSTGGSIVNVSGPYQYDSWVDLNATPDTHWEFDSWSGGVEFPNAMNTRVQMTSDKNVTASFREHNYTLSISYTGKGSVTGAGPYTFNTPVTISATPSTGYYFSHWNGYGPDNNNSTTTFNIQGDHSLTAVFSPFQHTINVTSSDGGSAAVGPGPHLFDGNYTITAIPDSGYQFQSWTSTSNSLNILSSNSTAVSSLILDGNSSFHANFMVKDYFLTVTMGEGGVGVSPPSGSYSHFSIVPVEANASTGYAFNRWDDPSGILNSPLSPSTDANMSIANGNAAINAQFSKKTYDVNVTEGSGGNVILASGPYEHFGVYDLVANPHANYLFSHWSGDSNSTSSLMLGTSSATNKIVVSGPIVLTANFIVNPTTLTYTVDLNSSVGGTAQLALGSNPFSYDSNVTIQATPGTGYNFLHWTSFTNSLSFLSSSTSLIPYLSVTQNLSFTAHFEENKYALNVSNSLGGASVSPLGTTLHTHFSTTPVSASPNYGYKFKNWDDPNGLLANALDANTTAVFAGAGKDSNITAIFEPKSYNVELNQTVGGTITLESAPSGPWYHFQNYNISAGPASGYRFVNWLGDQAGLTALSKSALEANNTLSLIEPISLSANFEIVSYTVQVDPSAGGTVSGGGSFTVLNNPSISAVPLTGWDFSGWVGDTHALVSTLANPAVVNLSGFPQNLNYIASFNRQTFTVEVNIQGNGKVNDSNTSFSSTHPFQHSLSLIPTPVEGWAFINWLGVPESQKNDNPLLLSVTENLNPTAVFSKNSYTVSIENVPHGLGSGGGTYLFDSNVTLEAVPNKGYSFSHWEGNTSVLSDPTMAKITLKMPGTNLSLTPSFSALQNVITTQAQGSGSITGGGTFLTGTNVVLTANPDIPDSNSLNGYQLSYWQWTTPEGVSSTSSENPLTLQVDSNLSVQGFFSAIPYSMHNLTVNKTADGGHIFDDPGKATWNAAIQSTYKTLIATTKDGWKFSSWTENNGSLTISNPLETSSEFILATDSIVNANFAKSPFKIQLSANSGGSVSFSEKSVEHGETVSISATPNSDMDFASWEIQRSVEYELTVSASGVSANRNVYYLNGQERPALSFYRGFSYIFKFPTGEENDFYLSSSPISTSDANGDLSSSLSKSSPSISTLSFQIPENCPSVLYYHSKSNRGMGGCIKVYDFSENQVIADRSLSTNSFVAMADLSLKASFSKKQYSVNFSSSTGGNLSKTLNGVFEVGSLIEISAIPNAHYNFVEWQGVETTVAKNKDLSLNLSKPLNVNAIFAPINYNFSTTTNLDHNDSILVSRAAPYNFGQIVSVEALPIEHYQFSSWSGVSQSTSSKIDLTINGNTNLQANYSKSVYDISVSPIIQNYIGLATEVFNESFGSITKGESSTFNTVLSLSASPSERFEFLHWKNSQGNILSNLPSLSHTVQKSEMIYGVIKEKASVASISVSPLNSGEILLNGNAHNFTSVNSLPFGIPQEFTPKPRSGYTFVHWEVNNEISKDTLINYSGVGTLVLTAVYEPLPYPLNIVVYPEGSGMVVTQNSSLSFLTDSQVSLSAIPNAGYKFSYWNGNVNNVNDPQTSVTMREGLTIYAYFSESTVNAQATVKTLTINGELSNSTDGGYVNIASSYRMGTQPTVSAFPYEGFTFMHWEDEGGNIFSTSRIATVPKLTKDLNVRAVFKVRSYDVDFFVSPLAGGHLFIQGTKVVGSHTFQVAHGEYLLITAVANPRYTFKEWDAEFGIIDLPKVSSASVKIISESKITANFEATEKVLLTLQSSPANAGWFFGQGSHAPNQSHPLFAKARQGYEFVRWEGSDSIQNSANPSTNFSLIEDIIITAVFKIVQSQIPDETFVPPGIHMLNLMVNDSTAGVVIGSGVFGTGWVDISCEAKEGFIFRRWEGEGVEDPYSSQTKVFLAKDEKITAYFDKISNTIIPSSVIPNSVNLGAGWLSSNWFGSYWRKSDDHWVLHSKLNWIYLIPYSNDSIWLWSDRAKDWLWTSKSVFPYFLKGANSKWIWFDRDNSTPVRQLFFEYYDAEGNGTWHIYK